jgi:hypothetical protein
LLPRFWPPAKNSKRVVELTAPRPLRDSQQAGVVREYAVGAGR